MRKKKKEKKKSRKYVNEKKKNRVQLAKLPLVLIRLSNILIEIWLDNILNTSLTLPCPAPALPLAFHL
jgi:hypothetical protein